MHSEVFGLVSISQSISRWLSISAIRYLLITQNECNKQTLHLHLGKQMRMTRHTHTRARERERERERERASHWLVLPQWQTHVLLHLLQAVVVGVDEVKGQRSCQRAASSSWRNPQKPADDNSHCNPEEDDTKGRKHIKRAHWNTHRSVPTEADPGVDNTVVHKKETAHLRTLN